MTFNMLNLFIFYLTFVCKYYVVILQLHNKLASSSRHHESGKRHHNLKQEKSSGVDPLCRLRRANKKSVRHGQLYLCRGR